MRFQSCSPQSWDCSDETLALPMRDTLLTTLSVLEEQCDKSVNSLTPPAYRKFGFHPLEQPQAPRSCNYPVISLLLLFPAEPGWLSVPTMKLLNAAVFFILAPTLTPGLDPLSTSIFMGGAAVTWQLLSPHFQLKCSLLECCNMKDTLNLPGRAGHLVGQGTLSQAVSGTS